MDTSAISPGYLAEPASQWLGPHVLDLLEKAGLGTLFLNESGMMVYCNVSARKALGLHHRSLIGLQAQDLPLQEIMGLELHAMLKTQKTAVRTRLLIEGQEHEVLVGPIRVGPLQERGLLMLMRPIQSKTEQLATVGERVAATCHNLKNELCTLQSWLSLLQAKNGSRPPEEVATLQAMEQSLRSFKSRIEEVLHPIRHPQGDVVEIIGLVEHAWAHACHTLGELWSGQLRLEVEARALHTITARDRLDEVLQNLFKNAMEASPSGWVRCSIDHESPWITIRIADEGEGPAEADLLRGASNKPGGHGLGLADAQRTLLSLGGALDLLTLENGHRALLLRVPAV